MTENDSDSVLIKKEQHNIVKIVIVVFYIQRVKNFISEKEQVSSVDTGICDPERIDYVFGDKQLLGVDVGV